MYSGIKISALDTFILDITVNYPGGVPEAKKLSVAGLMKEYGVLPMTATLMKRKLESK